MHMRIVLLMIFLLFLGLLARSRNCRCCVGLLEKKLSFHLKEAYLQILRTFLVEALSLNDELHAAFSLDAASFAGTFTLGFSRKEFIWLEKSFSFGVLACLDLRSFSISP